MGVTKISSNMKHRKEWVLRKKFKKRKGKEGEEGVQGIDYFGKSKDKIKIKKELENGILFLDEYQRGSRGYIYTGCIWI